MSKYFNYNDCNEDATANTLKVKTIVDNTEYVDNCAEQVNKKFDDSNVEISTQTIQENNEANYEYNEEKYEHQTIQESILDMKYQKIKQMCQQMCNVSGEKSSESNYDIKDVYTDIDIVGKSSETLLKLKSHGIEVNREIEEPKIKIVKRNQYK